MSIQLKSTQRVYEIGSWGRGRGEREGKVNKAQWAQGVRTNVAKIAFHLDTHEDESAPPLSKEKRGFNKKFKSDSRDFVDDRFRVGGTGRN